MMCKVLQVYADLSGTSYRLTEDQRALHGSPEIQVERAKVLADAAFTVLLPSFYHHKEMDFLMGNYSFARRAEMFFHRGMSLVFPAMPSTQCTALLCAGSIASIVMEIQGIIDTDELGGEELFDYFHERQIQTTILTGALASVCPVDRRIDVLDKLLGVQAPKRFSLSYDEQQGD